MKIRKVKRFLAGLVLDAAGVIVLAMGCIGAYMTVVYTRRGKHSKR